MSKWPMVTFGEILTPNKRPYELGPTEDANLVGMRLYGKGPFHRELKPAIKIKKKSHFVIRSGDVIYNKLFAWKGTFGVVPDDLDGMFVSDKFPTYDADRSRVSIEYLRWYFQYSPLWDQARDYSKGAAALSKLTLNPSDFPKLTIPLPPLSEQKKIVKWIDAVATRVEEAKQLVEQTSQQIDDLSRSLLWTNNTETTPTRMSELVEKRSPDVEVKPTETYSFAGVYCFGRGVFAGQTKSGMDFKYPKLTRLRARNFTYPKLMAWEGAFGVVPDDCDGLVVSTEFPVFEIDEDKVLPEVLDIYFKTPSIWPKVAGASTGTNVRRRRLNPKDFLNYEFPLPPRKTQEQIAEIRSRTEAPLAERQATIDELDGLMKSVLNQVFNGEGTVT